MHNLRMAGETLSAKDIFRINTLDTAKITHSAHTRRIVYGSNFDVATAVTDRTPPAETSK